jgi:predicted ATPase/class 3 adenylate cyclase/Tfp pilus assembly protein PilF
MRMSRLPTGTVTFVLTDIEGSTRLLHTLGPRYREALEQHRALVRAAFTSHGGVEVDTQGDAFFYAFAEPQGALQAAIRAQRSLADHSWPEEIELRVRMGIHTGAPEVTDQGYVGKDVHMGARICAAAWGGQILVSSATAALASSSSDDVTLRSLGHHALKDIDARVELFEVVAPDLIHDFPPLRTHGSHPTNLPSRLAPLIGRDHELASLAELLASAETSVVTLVGPGGTGKTSIAAALGAQLLSSFPDGVFFVDLSALTDPSLVVPQIAQTLSLRETPGRSLRDTLIEHLSEKATFLIIDNLEQVIDAAEDIAALLTSAPQLKVLATSREALRITGERVYSLAPLEVPSRDEQDPEELERYPAVALFVERARAVNASFSFTEENAADVTSICRRLDGLPLAIELAAARVNLLAPSALLARLASGPKVLASGRRDAAARQKTLRSAMAWSYDLLSEEEQKLFRRLGVFAGGWSLQAAERLCDKGDLDLDPLDGLASLVEKSLVRAVKGPEERFSMLEMIRSFAADELEASGESEEIRRAHADYFRELAQEAEQHLVGVDQKTWLDRLERDHDNLRTALEWGLRYEPRTALVISAGLWRFWDIRGYVTEARRWLAETLSRDFDDSSLHARVMYGAGCLAEAQGDLDEARRLVSGAGEIFRNHGDSRDVVLCLIQLGVIAWLQGDLAEARDFSEEAVTVARHHRDAGLLGRALTSLGERAVEASDLDEARRLYEQALVLMRRAQDHRGILWVTTNLGELELHGGHHQRAKQYLDEALSLAETAGDSFGRSSALVNLGLSAMLEEDCALARSNFLSALEIAARVGSLYLVAGSLEGMAITTMIDGRPHLGARLFGAAQRVREQGRLPEIPLERALYEHHLAAAMATLGDETWREAVAEGQTMTAEQALHLLLGASP